MRQFLRIDAPARIGLVSDTHIKRHKRVLPRQMLEAFDGCTCIFHAGDICVERVLTELDKIAPVYAVHGNNDVAELVETLPRDLYFQIGVHMLGLTHGHAGGGPAQEVAQQRMRGIVDCVVYGHSHNPEVVTRQGLMMVNPGSPTDMRFGRTPTYGLLTVDERIQAQIVELE